jgi:hypothetical protein
MKHKPTHRITKTAPTPQVESATSAKQPEVHKPTHRSRFVRGAGATALVAVLASGAAFGLKAWHDHSEAKFRADQTQIKKSAGPLLRSAGAAVLREVKENPREFSPSQTGSHGQYVEYDLEIPPSGSSLAEETVIMGTDRDGKPDASKTVFATVASYIPGQGGESTGYTIWNPAGAQFAAGALTNGSTRGWNMLEDGGQGNSSVGVDLDTTDPAIAVGIGGTVPTRGQVAREISRDYHNDPLQF